MFGNKVNKAKILAAKSEYYSNMLRGKKKIIIPLIQGHHICRSGKTLSLKPHSWKLLLPLLL